jgi:hypothetical protein
MTTTTPGEQFGYLLLQDVDFETNFVLIKANKILSIRNALDEEDKPYSYIDVGLDDNYAVRESFEEILNKLEAIHPSLR